jgi:hypothetical protein
MNHTQSNQNSTTFRNFGWFILLFLCIECLAPKIYAQQLTQKVSGTVSDRESHQPLAGTGVVCETCIPVIACTTDSSGYFTLIVPIGRQTIAISMLGYQPQKMNDILVGSGKAVTLNIELSEQVIETEEISVKASNNRWLNPMAAVSARTLKSDDAARYAAGYFDASRMVANFAGVASGNSDDSNEIVVRGNSPRGLLWRLEGIEIPNPNHFSNGQGSTGGGYTAVTTNVLSSFDFFSGSFPAEYGNATSGVMDLNLRSGSKQNRELSLGLSVLGAEISAEGPISKEKGSSFLFDYRLADFRYLGILGILKTKDFEIMPRTSDYAFKTSFKTGSNGLLDFFAVGGTSLAGDNASDNIQEIKSGIDRDEFIEAQHTAVAGLKYSSAFKNNKTYLKSTLGFTYQFTSSLNHQSDTLLRKTMTYRDWYEYPAIRMNTVVNHKYNALHSLRAGINFNQVWGNMLAIKLTTSTKYDTLINTLTNGSYGSAFFQWKYQSGNILETNLGCHLFLSQITREIIPEPRFGMILQLPGQRTFNIGLGFHSRLEPLSIYHYLTKISSTVREARNTDLKVSRAFHLTTGFSRTFSNNIQFMLEAYYQHLWAIPVNDLSTGKFSIINSFGGIPDVIMANKGFAKNKGLEITIEKPFSNHYFFLATASFFNSTYRGADGFWHNTFFNTNYIANIIGGKEFQLGRQGRNILEIKLRGMFRGGFRYTPVDQAASLKRNRIIYDILNTYGERLPDYKRMDFGMSYRINNNRNSLIFMADIQNIFDTENILRRKFSYSKKQIVTSDSKSFGLIPVLTIRTEF